MQESPSYSDEDVLLDGEGSYQRRKYKKRKGAKRNKNKNRKRNKYRFTKDANTFTSTGFNDDYYGEGFTSEKHIIFNNF